MTSHAASKINQKEYLKKYLSGDKVKKKKKKDKKRKKEYGTTKVKIIDDDATYKQTQEEFDEELLLGGEDAPQIVGEYIEENNKAKSEPKWRSIVVKEEPVEDNEVKVKVKSQPEEDLWGPKQHKRKIKDEFSPPRRIESRELHQRSPDNSPPRRKHNGSLPPRSPMADERVKGHLSKDSSVKRKHNSPKQSSGRRDEHAQHNSVRREKRRSPDGSPTRRRNKKSDKSSTNRINRSPIQSPQRNTRQPDQSPPRRNKIESVGRRHRSRSRDQSPPRKSNRSPDRPRNNYTYKSPPRKINRFSEKISSRSSSSDQSPPRKSKHKSSKSRKNRSRSVDNSPEQRRKRKGSPDQSPPRRRDTAKVRKQSESPARNRRVASTDQSPPRRYGGKRSPTRKRHDNGSPVRIKREKVSPDQSPPRRKLAIVKKELSPSPPPPIHSRWSKLERRGSDSPPPTHKPKVSKTLDGKKAGLQDAKSLMDETEERRKREERMYNEMSKEVSGRDAEVRVRSTGRKGQRARDAEAEDPEERRRKEEHERKKKEKYDRWGKGLKQVEEHRQRIDAESYEGSKPLARYENDDDLDRYLREQERADDPMLEYMRKKKKERHKETGDVVEMPKYVGSYPENRFSIRPGYRWDGVDRSNGFEKKWFDVQNENRAQQEEAYLYSVEDM